MTARAADYSCVQPKLHSAQNAVESSSPKFLLLRPCESFQTKLTDQSTTTALQIRLEMQTILVCINSFNSSFSFSKKFITHGYQ
jgi:hypothetical protein